MLPKLLLFIAFPLLSFFGTFSGAIDCYQQAPTSVTYASTYNVFTCPASVGQCYKYVCVGEVYFIQKGCLDPHSPTQNCQVIQGQCQAQGGTGACYVCNGNRCNSALAKAGLPALWLILPMAFVPASMAILFPPLFMR